MLCFQSRSWLHAWLFFVVCDISNMQDAESVMLLVVWTPLFWDPSDGVFGRFDLAALLRLPHLKFFVCLLFDALRPKSVKE